MSQKVFPDDIIRVILESAYTTHPNLDLDESWFHTLIHISKNAFPHLFEDFSFNTSGTQPYSELLERILMRARISGKLSNTYKLASVEYLEKTLYPKFTPEDLQILKSIGRLV